MAQPSMTCTEGNLAATILASTESRSIAANFVFVDKREVIFSVNTPVPGPNSTTQRFEAMSAERTISSARAGDDGQIAPTEPGERSMAPMKRRDIDRKVGSGVPRVQSQKRFPSFASMV